MMDNYKFRAWDKKKKEMIYNGLELAIRFLHYDSNEDSLMSQEFIGFGVHYNEHFNIMQWIGVVDKNKKEIYSGDIISIPEGFDSDNSLTMSPPTTQMIRLGADQKDTDCGYWPNGPQGITWDDVEVVGNSYESLYLLEQS